MINSRFDCFLRQRYGNTFGNVYISKAAQEESSLICLKPKSLNGDIKSTLEMRCLQRSCNVQPLSSFLS